MASLSSPKHNKNASNAQTSAQSIGKASANAAQSEVIILAENENMDIDGALDNSLLSELPGSDFR